MSAYVCAWWCDDEADAGAYVDAGVLSCTYAWSVCAFIILEDEVPAFACFVDWRCFHRFDGFVVGDAAEVIACLIRVNVYDEPSGGAGDNADVGVR